MKFQTTFAATILCISGAVQAQSDVEVTTFTVTDNIHMLQGNGGNVGLFTGSEGSLLIDDQYAPMTPKLLAAIESVGGKTPRFLLNTHYHGDHTGGNENFGERNAVIMAHDNVRQRLTTETFIKAFNMKTPPQPAAALPVITFPESMTLHINGETIAIQYLPNAHTDGDSYVHFKDSNVIHTGDLFFNGFYPFIDVEHGGTVQGMIDGADVILAASNDSTQIIPGHGSMASKADLQAYRDMLATVLERLSAMRTEGKDIAAVLEANPLNDLDAEWGDGFLDAKTWLSIIYPSVK